MATVYERLKHYESQSKGKFSFPIKHRKVIGSLIRQEFIGQITNLGSEIPTTISEEDGGTFRVLVYPDEFTSAMDTIISNYVVRITTPKPKKISQSITEKPKVTKQATPQKIAASDPKKKERKRIPLNKPAFSGNKFK